MSERFTQSWHRRTRPSLLAIAAIALFASAVQSQASPQDPPAAIKVPTYDIISIKPNKTGSGHVSVHSDDGNYDATNVSLKHMLLDAYSLKESQLANLPPWAESARFDIRAKILEPDLKVLGSLTRDQFQSMLQPILTDRFALTSHRETKVLPVYELTIVKGPVKFKQTPDDGGKGHHGMSVHNRDLTATGQSMESLVSELSSQTQRIVIDKTGLQGNYDFALSWSADDAPPTDLANAPPTLFTALQEQLGLKLVSAKSSISTLVVDHVEMPSEN